jgi:hypothetical protein
VSYHKYMTLPEGIEFQLFCKDDTASASPHVWKYLRSVWIHTCEAGPVCAARAKNEPCEHGEGCYEITDGTRSCKACDSDLDRLHNFKDEMQFVYVRPEWPTEVATADRAELASDLADSMYRSDYEMPKHFYAVLGGQLLPVYLVCTDRTVDVTGQRSWIYYDYEVRTDATDESTTVNDLIVTVNGDA